MTRATVGGVGWGLDDRLRAAGREPDEIDAALQHARLTARLFDTPAAPPRLGRYRVLEVIGRGGMGTVYRARDGRLDREVAVKRMHATANAQRLVAEARAMAAVTDDHVVPVFDAGLDDGRPFIVMAYVAGGTLRTWLQTPRPWPQIVEAFVMAGRGLAAAHAAGILHRDFKPDNVLVGRDGRVRVTDFGLARAADPRAPGATHAPEPTPAAPDPVGAAALAGPTRSGAVLGTPAYMAPEQARGAAVDARADIYSLCVALHEALCGWRPRGGVAATTPITTARARRDGRGTAVPGAVVKVVNRGLATRPEDRWPSVHALTEALRAAAKQDRGRRWWRRGGGVAAAIGLGVAVLALRPGGSSSREASRPTTRLPPWTELQSRVQAQLAQGRVRATAKLLTETFHTAVAQRRPTLAAAAAAELVFVEGHVLHRLPAGEMWARHARAQLQRAPEDPLIEATLCRHLGILRQQQGRTDDVHRLYTRALTLRRQHLPPEDPAVGHAYESMATLHYEREEFERAVVLYKRALHIVARAPGNHDAALAMILDDLGNAVEDAGDRDAAQRWYARALALRAGLPAEHPGRAISWANLGTAARRAGRYDEAEAHHRRALAIRMAHLGPSHPTVGISLADLGEVFEDRGQRDEARDMYSRARVIIEAAHGTDHPRAQRIAGHLRSVAAVREDRG